MQKLVLTIEQTRKGLALAIDQEGTGRHPDELAVAAAMEKVMLRMLNHFYQKFSADAPKNQTPEQRFGIN